MSHAVRRLLGLSTLLSTLIGTLGLSHGACEPQADGIMAGMAGQHAMPGAVASDASGVGHDRSNTSGGCNDMANEGDGVPGAPAGPCSMVAHCGSAALASQALTALPLAWAQLPREGPETQPTDPAHEPELQPPKT